MAVVEVPVWEKRYLTIQEAAALFNIGEKTLRSLTKGPNDYTLLVGSKVLIRKNKFERWLENQYIL